jgi:hypothetical protein
MKLKCDYEELGTGLYYVPGFLPNVKHWQAVAERCDKHLNLAEFYLGESRVTQEGIRNQKVIPWKSYPKIPEVIEPAYPKDFLEQHEHYSLFSEFAKLCQENIEFDGTEYFHLLELQRTTEGGHFNWHRDRDKNKASVRILSVLCYINDEFEGGETEFVVDDAKLTVTPISGDAVIFDPNLLHRGCPVKTGIKRSVLGIFGK